MALFDAQVEAQHREAREARESAAALREQRRLKRIHNKYMRQERRILASLPSWLDKARQRAVASYRRGHDADATVLLPPFRTVLLYVRKEGGSPFVRHTAIGDFFETQLTEHSVEGWRYSLVRSLELFGRQRIIGIRATHS